MAVRWILVGLIAVTGIGGLYLRDYWRKKPPHAQVSASTVVTLVGIAALALVLLSGLITVTLGRARASARLSSSANNLSAIGQALRLYRDVPASGGRFPQTCGAGELLRLLHPDFVRDPRAFLNPNDLVEVPDLPKVPVFRPNGSIEPAWSEAVGYVYVNPGDPPAALAIVAFERHSHNGGRNVLRASGSVEWMDDDAFSQELRATQPGLTPEQPATMHAP